MKQIKCSGCSGIWYVEDEEVKNSEVCPFCLKEVRKEIKITGTDTIGKIIYQAISDKGLEFLSSNGRMTGFLLDVAQGVELKREAKIFSKTFNDDYLKIYQKAFELEWAAAKDAIKRLKQKFVDEEGISEEWAKIICKNCLEAIKYYKRMGIEYVVLAEITDFKEYSKGGN